MGPTSRQTLGDEVVIRAATDGDRPDIVAMAGAALGWNADEPNDALFRWKHLDNPFGPSPAWVAEIDGRLAAFRTFLRWRWQVPDGSVAASVRAVDTATHPDFQGRGLFSTLTRHALEEVAAEGVQFVFNTPNGQSRPGYLKMGWEVVGRVPVAVAVRSPRAALRMARARVPAEKWSLPTTAGEAAADVLEQTGEVADLLASLGPPRGLRTDRTLEFLRWRYATGPLEYRVLLRRDRVADGFAVFRLRRRAGAVEATICDVLAPSADPWATHSLVGAVLRAARPDYAIRVQPGLLGPAWSVSLPRQGPILTWRGLHGDPMPPMERWSLRLGDIELF